MNNEQLERDIKLIKELAERCLSGLKSTVKQRRSANPSSGVTKSNLARIDFDIPIRPFVKLYSKGLAGPKKFTLIVAYLSKGDFKKEVTLAEIEKTWNKMTAPHLLGMKFNRFYAGQAKDNDWVETKKKGTYNLRPSWKVVVS
jgi:excinuclease UvrABC ATPase subunit